MTLQATKPLMNRQRGAAQLFVTVVLLMVVMMLGITAIIVSTTQFNLAGNLQLENIAFNLAEGSSATAENWLSDPAAGNSTNVGFTTYSTGTPYLYPIGYLATNSIVTLDGARTIGVSAGASAPEFLVTGVVDALARQLKK